jgi:hypothetical protein
MRAYRIQRGLRAQTKNKEGFCKQFTTHVNMSSFCLIGLVLRPYVTRSHNTLDWIQIVASRDVEIQGMLA